MEFATTDDDPRVAVAKLGLPRVSSIKLPATVLIDDPGYDRQPKREGSPLRKVSLEQFMRIEPLLETERSGTTCPQPWRPWVVIARRLAD